MKNYTEFETDIIRSFLETNGLTAEDVRYVLSADEVPGSSTDIARYFNHILSTRLTNPATEEAKDGEWEYATGNEAKNRGWNRLELEREFAPDHWETCIHSEWRNEDWKVRFRRKRLPEPKDDNFLYFAPGETVIQEGDEFKSNADSTWNPTPRTGIGHQNLLYYIRRPKPAQQAVEKDPFIQVIEQRDEAKDKLDAAQKRVGELEKDKEWLNQMAADRALTIQAKDGELQSLRQQVAKQKEKNDQWEAHSKTQLESYNQLSSTLAERETDLRLESNKVERMRGEVGKLTKELTEREKELAEFKFTLDDYVQKSCKELSTLRQRGGQLTAEQVEKVLDQHLASHQVFGGKTYGNMADELNAHLSNPWTLITSDPASLPTKKDANEKGEVLWRRGYDCETAQWDDNAWPYWMRIPHLPTEPQKAVEDDGFEKWVEGNGEVFACLWPSNVPFSSEGLKDLRRRVLECGKEIWNAAQSAAGKEGE